LAIGVSKYSTTSGFGDLNYAEADAEARAAWIAERMLEHAQQQQILDLFLEQEADRVARVDASRPMLRGMSSAEILDLLHDAYEHGSTELPCDQIDVIHVVLDEVGRRREATGHERIRLRELDRKS